MKIFGLAGWSGSGKTRLLARLLPELTKGGRLVSTIKHAHHHFDVDQPGKDQHGGIHHEAGENSRKSLACRRPVEQPFGARGGIETRQRKRQGVHRQTGSALQR